MYVDHNRQPIFITTAPSIRETEYTDASVPSVTTIPDTHATPGCLCSATILANNLPSLHYGLICKPACLYKRYAESATEPSDMQPGKEKMMALHHIFKGEINIHNTALPKLTRRTPTAILQRQNLVDYQPPLAQVNLKEDEQLAAAVCAQMMKPDFALFTADFSQPCGTQPSIKGHKHRYQPANNLAHNIDVSMHASAQSVEDILFNSSTAEPFSGKQTCPYCAQPLEVRHEGHLIKHLNNYHLNLTAAGVSFSCPGCMTPYCPRLQQL